MATQEWLKRAFADGYDSGDVLAPVADPIRAAEERAIGGSYFEVVQRAIVPYVKRDSRVLEVGPGKGSWTRALLSCAPEGIVHTVDFLDVTPWLQPARYGGRLICHQVADNSFDAVPREYFDFLWSFGVLCHTNVEHIAEILIRTLPAMQAGGIAVHQYGDWTKLDAHGWHTFAMPEIFKSMPDDEIWWPRNSRETMARLAAGCGWSVLADDLALLKRDSLIVLQKLPNGEER
jgi:phospholipid N-methyltransferase